MSILEMSVSGGLMILAAALLRLIAGDRLPRRAYVALWAACALRLLVPVKIASRLSIYGLLSRSSAQAEQIAATAASKTAASFPIWTVLWLTGAAATGFAFAVSYIRCVRAFRVALPAENRYVTRWLLTHPLRRRVEARTLAGLKTPLTYGLLRPVILLPEEAGEWDSERLGMVLCHEYTHIRRFDGALKKLAALALCVHWWNPAAWVMYALLNRDIELACDGAVVDVFGPECRARYARLLIDLKAPKGAAPLIAGFGKNVTEKRVRGVMGHKRAGRLMSFISGVLIMTVIVTFSTSAKFDKPITESPLENVSNTKTVATASDRFEKKSDIGAESGSHALNGADIRACEVAQIPFEELSNVLSGNQANRAVFVPMHNEDGIAYVIN